MGTWNVYQFKVSLGLLRQKIIFPVCLCNKFSMYIFIHLRSKKNHPFICFHPYLLETYAQNKRLKHSIINLFLLWINYLSLEYHRLPLPVQCPKWTYSIFFKVLHMWTGHINDVTEKLEYWFQGYEERIVIKRLLKTTKQKGHTPS